MTYEKIVVTGGAGLLGSHVVKEMEGHAQITTLDLKEPKFFTQVSQNHVNVSITNYEEVKKAFMGHDAVIHLAAIPNPREADAKTTFNNNVHIRSRTFNNISDCSIMVKCKVFTITHFN